LKIINNNPVLKTINTGLLTKRRGPRGEQIFARRANTRGTTYGCSTEGAPLLGAEGALNVVPLSLKGHRKFTQINIY